MGSGNRFPVGVESVNARQVTEDVLSHFFQLIDIPLSKLEQCLVVTGIFFQHDLLGTGIKAGKMEKFYKMSLDLKLAVVGGDLAMG